ncbi:uncharacterized protein si:dkey-260g12.1 [Scomber scombrus]|uniref:uncharacterized protein si:dkey-260g12.1 n=1 Tax=Scomber scombrus TaxID=13677 RepID=UPI002DDAC980|nr:uncharacterized protein si:dkey-260g12.1 [Scomber scombrus]
MGLVQYCVTVLMLSAQLVFTLPLDQCNLEGGRTCKRCPAGMYQKSCTECEPCPVGSYTTEDNNCEDSCHRCYRDCRPELNLKVIQECTPTTNIKCVCEDGFRCTVMVPYSQNCKYCEKIQYKTTTVAAAVITNENKQTPSSASSASASSSARPCRFPKCGLQPVTLPGNGTNLPREGRYSSHLAAILCPVVAVGCAAFVIRICLRCTKDETCFKLAVAKVCNMGGRDASHKSKESTHQFPRDSFSARQQPSSLSAANLGPVHVHNPGTVIFSLLSQFTGQVGPTSEMGKTAERVSSEEDDKSCPDYHPASSPSVHLSEEERSGDAESFIFPSQEQGKDCHMSKEEAL